MQAETKSRAAWLLLVGACLLMITLMVFWPLHSAGMTGDDWSILARVLHQGNPLPLVLNDHSQTYLYRPVAMSFWWLTGKLFAANPAPHYAASVALHLLNAGLLFVLARSCGARRSIALAASGLFAIHPASVATTAWLSDRFDLLATAFILATLVSLTRMPSRVSAHWALPVLLSFLAMACKETAVILLPVVSVWAMSATPRYRRRAAVIGAVGVSALIFVLMRRRALGTWGGGTLAGSPTDAALGVIDGLGHWLGHAGLVVLGVPGVASVAASTIVGVLVVVALVVGFLPAGRHLSRSGVACVLSCGTLFLCAGIAQAPVTRLVLSAPAPFGIVTNLRFYYLALASLVLLAALLGSGWLDRRKRLSATDSRPKGNRLIGRALTATGVAIATALLAFTSFQTTARWARETGETSRVRMQQAAVDAALTVQPTPGCLVSFLNTTASAHEFPLFADSIIKAQLPGDSPLLDCIMLTERSPYIAFTSLHAREGFHDLPQRPTASGRPGPYVSGELLVWILGEIDRCEWSQRGRIHSFLWNGSEFASLRPDQDPMLASCTPASTP